MKKPSFEEKTRFHLMPGCNMLLPRTKKPVSEEETGLEEKAEPCETFL
jgi:hypothetical protein